MAVVAELTSSASFASSVSALEPELTQAQKTLAQPLPPGLGLAYAAQQIAMARARQRYTIQQRELQYAQKHVDIERRLRGERRVVKVAAAALLPAI